MHNPFRGENWQPTPVQTVRISLYIITYPDPAEWEDWILWKLARQEWRESRMDEHQMV